MIAMSPRLSLLDEEMSAQDGFAEAIDLRILSRGVKLFDKGELRSGEERLESPLLLACSPSQLLLSGMLIRLSWAIIGAKACKKFLRFVCRNSSKRGRLEYNFGVFWFYGRRLCNIYWGFSLLRNIQNFNLGSRGRYIIILTVSCRNNITTSKLKSTQKGTLFILTKITAHIFN